MSEFQSEHVVNVSGTEIIIISDNRLTAEDLAELLEFLKEKGVAAKASVSPCG